MPPIVRFNHNLGNDEKVSAVMDTYIAIAATSNGNIKNKQLLADDIKNYIQGPPEARYSADQIDQNVKQLNKVYIEKYEASEKLQYKVKRPNDTFITKYGLTVDNNKVGKNISDAITGFDPTTFYQLLEDDNAFNFDDKLTKYIITPDNATEAQKEKIEKSADGNPVAEEQEKIAEEQEKLGELAAKGRDGIKFLENIPLPYFLNDEYKNELGTIGNIFINLRMLYEMALDSNLEAQDKKEKKEIALYDFIKNIMSKVSDSIGNVNNFEIFIEPNGNTARIIDINYVDNPNNYSDPKSVYDNAFELQLHNLKSVVRSYKLESKIFQEQSNMIAIGAQTGGGALGTDTTSLVTFNRGIRDRIIPVKNAPIDNMVKNNEAKAKVDALLSNLETLYSFFGRLESGLFADADYDVDKASGYSNALKDLINYLKSLTDSQTSNKSILPTVLSIDMDGMGGLIIGNLFKVNTDILPKGYKGSGQGGIGPNLGYVITGIGHTVGNGDWVTKIDAQTVILDSPKSEYGKSIDYSNITINLNPSTEKEIVLPSPPPGQPTLPPNTNRPRGGTKRTFNGKEYNNGQVEELLVPMRPDLEKKHKTIYYTDKGRARLQRPAMKSLEALLEAAARDGVIFKILNCYRTVDDQVNVWGQNCLNQIGSGKCINKLKKSPAAIPGTSNHGFGLAVDIGQDSGTGGANAGLRPFRSKKHWEWMSQNSLKYGWKCLVGSNYNEAHHYDYIGPI